MKRSLLILALAFFVLIDHLIWFYTGFAADVSIPYATGSEVFRAAMLVCAVASLRRPRLVYWGLRGISIYAFACGALVATAYSLALNEVPEGMRNFLGFWRLPVEPPLSACLVALTCVAYLAACSLLLPRCRNL